MDQARTERAEFQSAPGGEAGGNVFEFPADPVLISFNPPPAVRPGETPLERRLPGQVAVSIRPRR